MHKSRTASIASGLSAGLLIADRHVFAFPSAQSADLVSRKSVLVLVWATLTAWSDTGEKDLTGHGADHTSMRTIADGTCGMVFEKEESERKESELCFVLFCSAAAALRLLLVKYNRIGPSLDKYKMYSRVKR